MKAGFLVITVLMNVVLFGGLVVAIVLLRSAGRRRRERWTARMAAWAPGAGYQVLPAAAGNRWLAWLPVSASRVTLVLSGAHRGRPVEVAEYEYTDTSGRHHRIRHVVAVAVRLQGQYPYLAVAERGLGSSLWRSLAGPGDAEIGQPAFDGQFRIHGRDPDLARRLLRPPLVSAMLTGRVPGWQLAGSELMAVYWGRLGPMTVTAVADTCWIADQVEAPALPAR